MLSNFPQELLKLNRNLIFCFFTLMLACLSCQNRTTSVETKEALDALRKIQAATQVGVNYQQYGQLVIDAKAKTNSASRLLPEGSIKKEMEAAIDAYADAGRAWSTKFGSSSRDNLYTDTEPGKTLIPKYSLPTEATTHAYLGSNPIDIDSAIQIIWQKADSHIQKLTDDLK